MKNAIDQGAPHSNAVRFAILLYLLALAPRLIFVLAAGHADLSLDEIEYHLLARNVAAGNGFRWYFGLLSSFRPPGYPFFLAGVYYFAGPSYYIARIVQTFIAASGPLLTYVVGRRAFNERTGRLGGLFLAFYPPLVLYSVSLLTENFFIPLLLLALLFVLNAEDARPRWNSAFAGLSFAAGILVRPELTYALPAIFVWMLWPRRYETTEDISVPNPSTTRFVWPWRGWVPDAGGDAGHPATRMVWPERRRTPDSGQATADFCDWRTALRKSLKQRAGNVAIIALIVATAVVPWSIRNTRLTGQFIYLDTRTGYNLYIGYRDGADGTFNMAAAQDLVNQFIKSNLAKLSGSGARLTDADVRRLLNDELLSYKRPITNYDDLRRRYNLDAAESDVVMHNWGKARALAFIREHPWRSLALIPLKFAHFWNLEHHLFLYAYSWNFIGPLPRAVLVAALLLLLSPFVFLTLFAAVGAVFAPALDRKLALILLPIFFYTGIHSVTFGEARFHYVVIPFLALLAAQGAYLLAALPTRWRNADAAGRKGLRRRAICLVLLATMLVSIWSYGIWTSRDNFRAVLSPKGNQSYLIF